MMFLSTSQYRLARKRSERVRLSCVSHIGLLVHGGANAGCSHLVLVTVSSDHDAGRPRPCRSQKSRFGTAGEHREAYQADEAKLLAGTETSQFVSVYVRYNQAGALHGAPGLFVFLRHPISWQET
jgi:hypothetical protein